MADLELSLQKHPLSKYLPDIKKRFQLDVLKAFYVAKETYLAMTNQNDKVVGFDVIVDQQQLKDTSTFLAEATRFLNQDKKDLL